MNRNNSFKSTLLTILLSIFCGVSSTAQVVCPKANISGFEQQHRVGDLYNGIENTTNVSSSKLYVTVKGENIYIQSNFKPDDLYEYPIKLATPKQMDYTFEDYVANIYFFGRENPPQAEEAFSFARDLRKNVEITVDPTVFNHPDFADLNFGLYKKLKIACPDDVAREVIKIIDKKKGTYELLVRYNDCISIRVKNQDLYHTFSSLKTKPFDSKKLKLISLLENSKTKDFIARDFSAYSVPINYNVDAFKQALLENKGYRTIILGHNEGEKFVTLDAGGKILFEIPIEEITKFQKENDLNLLLLCCNSGYSAGTGVLNKFNSLDVLERLKVAANNNSVESFINDLSKGTLEFVLDDAFFAKEAEVVASELGGLERFDLKVYVKGTDGNLIEPSIGRIIFLESKTGVLTAPPNDTTGNDSGSFLPDDPRSGTTGNNDNLYGMIGIGALALVLGYFIFKPKPKANG